VRNNLCLECCTTSSNHQALLPSQEKGDRASTLDRGVNGKNGGAGETTSKEASMCSCHWVLLKKASGPQLASTADTQVKLEMAWVSWAGCVTWVWAMAPVPLSIRCPEALTLLLPWMWIWVWHQHHLVFWSFSSCRLSSLHLAVVFHRHCLPMHPQQALAWLLESQIKWL
jgi:hypothetical protein